MLANIKALIVVLACASLVFALAKPLFLRFTAAEDFARRRFVWFALTIAAFLSPSFWLYLLIASPLLAWAGWRDSTPPALFVFLYFVIPPVAIAIPTVIIQQLFALTNARLLALVVLLPAVLARSTTPGDRRNRLGGLDLVLLSYGVLQLVLLMPYESITNTMRRGFLFFLDIYLVYFAFSRLLKDRRQLADVMGGLCLAAALFAPLAAFESLRTWLLYTGISEMWGDANTFAWLMRSESLRAQAATGHSITLGYFIVMAIGCWMYLKELQGSKLSNASFFTLLSVGLFFTYARGPWLAAPVVAAVAIMLGSRNAAQTVKIAFVPSLIVVAVIASPLGARILEVLPFVGNVDQDSVTQRQELAETTWRLVQQNPWFGNPFVLLDMEELRSGQNIIDLVNGYSQVVLFYGIAGLALFVGLFIGSLYKGYVTLRRSRAAGDVEMVWLGASLMACMVTSLLLMATSGQLYLQWVSAALLVAFAGLEVVERREATVGVVPKRAFNAGRTAIN